MNGSTTVDHLAEPGAGSPAKDDIGTTEATRVDTSEQTSQQTDKGAGAADETPEEVSTGLVTAEEYARVKDDPAALRKALLKGFTQATQKTADVRKSLGSWADVKDAFDEDPATALKALAMQFGVDIREPEKKPGQTQAEAVRDAGEQAVEKLKTVLAKVGLDELAEELAPVLREIAEGVAGKAVEPFKAGQDQILDESAQREAAAVMETFAKSHPEWKAGNDVDKKMAALAKTMPVAKDDKTGKALISDTDYLENLYFLATKDTAISKAAQDAVDRMTRSAGEADGTRTTTTVAGDKVAKTPPNEAYQAAKRGEVWNG